MHSFDPQFFKNLFERLDNNAVLRERNAEGFYEPICCTQEFAEMMDCTPEEFVEMERAKPLCTVIAEDRDEAAYLLTHGRTKNGESHAILRKQTPAGRIVWTDLHYTFFSYEGKEYAYGSYFDVTRLKENERQIEGMYESIRRNLNALSAGSLLTLVANLTRDQVEERGGKDMYGSDRTQLTYSELVRRRAGFLPLQKDRERFLEKFHIAHLAASFHRGEQEVSEVMFTRRPGGRPMFVKISATVTKRPYTGDLVVFLTERDYDADKVTETLHQEVLGQQYDMISYIFEGRYSVLIGEPGRIRKGNLFPKERNGDYRTYIEEQVLPTVAAEDADLEEMKKALSMETVRKRLKKEGFYQVNLTCQIQGEKYYKRFDFYPVDLDTDFCIVLKSDDTEVKKEELRRSGQLREALQEARQANAVKTAFLSRMSHEIRTPMNAIIGLDKIALQEPGLNDTLREYLEKIGSSAEDLLTLINDILDMDRLESGQMVLQKSEFSLTGLLDQVSGAAEHQCREKGLSWQCQRKGEFRETYIGDPEKLKQVLTGLLSNAVKFTEAGGVTLTAELLKQTERHGVVRFIVEDTGIGMDPTYLSHVFDAFSQEDGSSTNRYGGTGLGLAISKNMVDLMNGQISAASEKGKGSAFTVELTLQSPKAQRETLLDRDPDIRGCRILMAEDMVINAKIVEKLLTMQGATVDTAPNGRIAVERFRQEPEGTYDAVLMDIRMPEMDGLAAAEAIREIGTPYARGIPIVALTANAFDEDVQRSLQAGMNVHLSKPVEPTKLFQTLDRLIRENQ